jgi:hypothetical protein
MAKEWFLRAAIENTKFLIKKARADVQEEKKRAVEFPGHKIVKAAMKGTQLCFGKFRRMAAFLAKMALHRIHRQAGEVKAQVHNHQNDKKSRQQNQRHILLKCHRFHPVTMAQRTYPKSKVCHQNMYISILLFQVLKFSILIHMPKIASVIKI